MCAWVSTLYWAAPQVAVGALVAKVDFLAEGVLDKEAGTLAAEEKLAAEIFPDWARRSGLSAMAGPVLMKVMALVVVAEATLCLEVEGMICQRRERARA